MAGVPGGSKGCLTCRRRKIKCDLQTPVCMQCVKSRRQCSGPNLNKESCALQKRERRMPVAHRNNMQDLAVSSNASRTDKSMEHKFVIVSGTAGQLKIDRGDDCMGLPNRPTSTSDDPKRPPSAILKSTGEFSLPSISRSEDMPIKEVLSVLDQLALKKDVSGPGHVHGSPKEVTIECNFSIASAILAMDDVYFQNILSSFMDNFHGGFSSWITLMPSFVCSTSPALKYASRAAVVGHYSRVRPNRGLQLFGAQLYSQALRHQTHAVSWSIMRPALDDDIITSGLLLGIYEIFYCSSIDSWSKLMKGCLTLFELRGPHSFKAGYSATLFQSARTILTVYVLAVSTNSFLADPDWLSIPFETTPEKPPHQTLNDILLCIPKYQNVILSFRSKSQRRQKLAVEQRMAAAAAFIGLEELRLKLDKWLISYKQLISGIESDDLPDSVLYTANYYKKCDVNATNEQWVSTHLFKPPLIFVNNSVASLIPLYYAALGIIQRAQCLAYDCAQEFPCGHNDLVTVPLEEFESLTESLVARYNRLICQSVEYVVSSHPAIEALYMVYPLKIAHGFLKDPLEKYWAFKWCEKLDKMFGFGILMQQVEDDGRDNFIARTVDSLPTCPLCGEKLRSRWAEST
ncbi:hypothetical protein V1523DRAFT_440333 [Lipomyces doorenjongii]